MRGDTQVGQHLVKKSNTTVHDFLLSYYIVLFCLVIFWKNKISLIAFNMRLYLYIVLVGKQNINLYC